MPDFASWFATLRDTVCALPATQGGLLAAAAAAVFAAYVVFTAIGFGSALIAGPLLAQILPVTQVVPLLAALDLVASLAGRPAGAGTPCRAALGHLLPAMLIGIAAGTWLLVALPPRLLLGALGTFALVQGWRGLAAAPPIAGASPGPACLYGLAGGVCGALVGSGGFLYALHLGRSLDDPATIRATQGVLITVSTLIRSGGFLLAGLYASTSLLALLLVLLPIMALGRAAGRTLAGRLPRASFLRLLHGMLLLSGSALLLRGLA